LTRRGAAAVGRQCVFAADRLAQFRDAPLYYGWFNAKTLFDVLISHHAAGARTRDAPSTRAADSWNKNSRRIGF